eukprot:6187342-Pleurochrysis_carterae.AAC.1
MVPQICLRIACVLAERSRSVPQALGNLRSRWPPLPRRATLPEPPRRRVQPRARACSQPPKTCILYSLSLPARPDGSSGSFPVVENQIGKARQLRRAWCEDLVLKIDSNLHDLERLLSIVQIVAFLRPHK